MSKSTAVALERENFLLTRLRDRFDGARPADLFPGAFVPLWAATALERMADHGLAERNRAGEYALTPAGRREAARWGTRKYSGRGRRPVDDGHGQADERARYYPPRCRHNGDGGDGAAYEDIIRAIEDGG